ncbi:hypothetical protein SESBI_31359 [Sesbania bispinosa]|nr:hypothetical protein SESBI_31359 [Sesbania bispinosa]
MAIKPKVGSTGPIIMKDNSFFGPQSIKSLSTSIFTTMDVEFVGPNRLRYVDEPKPPDPIPLEGPNNDKNMAIQGHCQNGETKSSSQIQEMEEESTSLIAQHQAS